MTYKPRRERRARGGKAAETEPMRPEHGHQYNAQGSPEAKEETAASDGFKRGGSPKKHKEGGKVEGHAAKHHLGRRARGGHVKHEPHHDHKDGHHGMSVSIHHHRNKGGEVGDEGEKGEKEKPDERARGGHVSHKEHHGHRRARGGGAPFSHAHALSAPGNDKKTGPGENAETIP